MPWGGFGWDVSKHRAHYCCGATAGLSLHCLGADRKGKGKGRENAVVGRRYLERMQGSLSVEGQPKAAKEGGVCPIHQLLSPARTLSQEGVRLETRLHSQGSSDHT